MKNSIRISTLITLGILMSLWSYGQYANGTYNEFGPNTNANSANHAATTTYGHNAMNNATGGARLTVFGSFAGENNTTGNHNNFFGYAAGRYNTTGYFNNFFGDGAGMNNTIGAGNAGFGNGTLANVTTGMYNIGIGHAAGIDLVTGEYNITIGHGSLGSPYQSGTNPVVSGMNKAIAIGRNSLGNPTGSGNNIISIGDGAASSYRGGNNSVIIGANAGSLMEGGGNVAIGVNAGKFNGGDYNIFIGGNMHLDSDQSYDNHLFIGNGTNTEFIIGDIANGKLGINTNTPQNALDVCGKIRGDEVIIENNWCDFVFYKNYKLPTLKEEAKHIEVKGHLIGFESEEEMNGEIHIADVTKRQQVKIEEMILHLIQMEKENSKILNRLEQLETENIELKNEIQILKKS